MVINSHDKTIRVKFETIVPDHLDRRDLNRLKPPIIESEERFLIIHIKLSHLDYTWHLQLRIPEIIINTNIVIRTLNSIVVYNL